MYSSLQPHYFYLYELQFWHSPSFLIPKQNHFLISTYIGLLQVIEQQDYIIW